MNKFPHHPLGQMEGAGTSITTPAESTSKSTLLCDKNRRIFKGGRPEISGNQLPVQDHPSSISKADPSSTQSLSIFVVLSPFNSLVYGQILLLHKFECKKQRTLWRVGKMLYPLTTPLLGKRLHVPPRFLFLIKPRPEIPQDDAKSSFPALGPVGNNCGAIH